MSASSLRNLTSERRDRAVERRGGSGHEIGNAVGSRSSLGRIFGTRFGPGLIHSIGSLIDPAAPRFRVPFRSAPSLTRKGPVRDESSVERANPGVSPGAPELAPSAFSGAARSSDPLVRSTCGAPRDARDGPCPGIRESARAYRGSARPVNAHPCRRPTRGSSLPRPVALGIPRIRMAETRVDRAPPLVWRVTLPTECEVVTQHDSFPVGAPHDRHGSDDPRKPVPAKG